MSEALELVHEPRPAALAHIDQDNPVAPILQAILNKGVTSDSAAALEKICDLYMKMDRVKAERAFDFAFVKLQAALPSVIATKVVPNNDGTERFVFAPYEEIWAVVGPILTEYSFSVSYDMKPMADRLCATCILSHGGHSRRTDFVVRSGKGPPGTNEAQADSSSYSLAMRRALCAALNIVISHDEDARIEGAYITKAQADSLERRLESVKGDRLKFFKMAHAESFDTIRVGYYATLDNALLAKEKVNPVAMNAGRSGDKPSSLPGS